MGRIIGQGCKTSLSRQIKAAYDAPFPDDAYKRGGERPFQKHVPGAQGQPHITITGADHFLQGDKSEEWAQVVVEFISK